jgi:hypothetical protein
MNYQEFRRVLTAFADTSTNIDTSKGKLICEIRDEMIEATTRLHEGEVWVNENEQDMRGTTWLLQRVARVPILADRILTAFSEPDNFISPKAELLDQLDDAEPEGKSETGDATELTLEMLSRRPGGCSSVLYLTSDAGEGKTTLIAHLARIQAEKFKRKETDWLLVPIALGGKPFLRFDDLVVGFLGNRLRFPLYYFEAFMELVKLGVLVPAFDGFEEMFVQDAKGDALSAIGNLMRTMDSSGTVLIAARKAYFEYQDMRMQARLFDSIGKGSVVFSRLKLRRWEKTEFLEYCDKRCIVGGAQIYARVAERLKDTHPLLTRAVLVKRLLDVADGGKSLNELLSQIGNSPNDYFAVFVNAIIEREANEKWIDTSGEAAKPLLSVKDHLDLLSLIAQEMWMLSTDSVKVEVLDLITDLFCEGRRMPAAVSFQVKERTKQHALIVGADGARQTFAFDHEEFKNFFLGEAIGRLSTQAKQKSEMLGLLRRANLPRQACEAAVSVIRRSKEAAIERVAIFLQEVALLDGPSSFTQENAARLIIKILHGAREEPLRLAGLQFGSDALRELHLTKITFVDCSFGTTSLENAVLIDCHFEECHFERLELHTTARISGTNLAGGDYGSVVPPGKEEGVFDPSEFPALLRQAGFGVPAERVQPTTRAQKSEDADVKLFRRLLRCFQFRTHINENVVLRKMGPGAEMFIRNVVPKLLKGNILSQEWNPRDRQHRYHLAMSMERVHASLDRAGTSIDEFLGDVHPKGS